MQGVIVLLVILNLAAMGTIFFSRIQKPGRLLPPPGEGGPENIHLFLKNELNLTEQQMDRFKVLGDEHRKRTRPVQKEIHRLKMEMMDGIFNPESDEGKTDRIAEEIGRLDARMQKALFSHFRDFADICDKEQREKFRRIITEVLDLTRPAAPEDPGGPEGKRPPPGKKPPRKISPPN